MSVNGLQHPDTSFYHIIALSITYILLTLSSSFENLGPRSFCLFQNEYLAVVLRYETQLQKFPLSICILRKMVFGGKLKLCINNVIYSFLFVTRTFPHHVNLMPYSLVDQT